jgi:rare lipoprotein A
LRAALHKFASHGICGTKVPGRTFDSVRDRGAFVKRAPHEEETVLLHFRISQRRRLRDVLVAGTIAASAVGAAPDLAWAHSHAKQIGAHRTTSKEVPASEKSEDRDRHRSLRAKLFSLPHRKPANSPQSHAADTASGESESSGVASIYSDQQTASGEIMDAAKMTAAHRTLPFGTHVTVVNRSNGRSVVVRINDRGPFVRGRVIDLSPAAGRALNIDGLASVSLIVGDGDASHANEQLVEPVAQPEGQNGP